MALRQSTEQEPEEATPDIRVDVERLPRHVLPVVYGRLMELAARVQLRIAEASAVPSPATPTTRTIDADEAAAIAGTSRRWLLANTAGLRFRCDLSRKRPRFAEAGLRAWLTGRRSR